MVPLRPHVCSLASTLIQVYLDCAQENEQQRQPNSADSKTPEKLQRSSSLRIEELAHIMRDLDARYSEELDKALDEQLTATKSIPGLLSWLHDGARGYRVDPFLSQSAINV